MTKGKEGKAEELSRDTGVVKRRLVIKGLFLKNTIYLKLALAAARSGAGF